MKFNVAKIVGTVNQTTWSQVHVFLPEGEKLSSHGQLIAALSFAAKKEIEIASFGKEIIVRLQEIYYSNEAESRLKKVSQSMESLAAEFYNEVELNMALAVIVPLGEKKLVYAGRRGGGQVYLKRDEAVVGLLAAEENQQVVSGELKAFDKLVVGTSQFFKIVPESHLEMALKEDRAEAAVESLGALVHGREENSQAAAAVVMPIRQGFGGELSPTAQGKGVEPADVKSLSAVSRLTALASSAGQRFRGLIKQAVERVSKRGGAEVFVRPGASRGKKSTATVMIVLVVIFGLSLVLAGRKRQVRVREEKYQAVVEEVSYKVDEGEGLLELNPLRARSLLSEAQGLIDNYKSENEGEVSGELSDLEKRLGDLLAQAQREYAVESADEWFDFGLVKEGFKATAWASDEGKVLIWGEGERTVVELDLTSKSSEIVAGGDEVGSGNLIALTGERGMVVGKDKMVVVDVSGGEVAAEVAADGWGRIVSAVGFGGNLYLLDAVDGGQIWKYFGVEAGLSDKREYLAGEAYDLSAAVAMAIDASIYVLFDDGTIVKYTRGAKDAFAVTGLNEPFGEPVGIFTASDQDNIYVLDRAKTRVVVVDKSGEYQAEYRWPGIAGVKDLVVNEELGKIFLLADEKVFTLDLNK